MNTPLLTHTLKAGALGDAFGYAIEFDSWGAIVDRHGAAGLVAWPREPGSGSLVASDDTQMTIFAAEAVANALAKQGSSLDLAGLVDESGKAFLRWFDTQGDPRARSSAKGVALDESLWRRRAPGGTCLTALSAAKRGALHANQSKGCGAAMRAAPYAALGERFGVDFVWRAASAQGKLTHHHADGHLPGAALAWILAHAPATAPDLARLSLDAADRAEMEGGVGTARRLRQAVDFGDMDLDPEALCDTLGEGWVGDEAVGVAVWCALRATSLKNAIWLGANHRGDSDSTASMAAQIAAARFASTPELDGAASWLDLATPLSAVSNALSAQLAKLSSVAATPRSSPKS